MTDSDGRPGPRCSLKAIAGVTEAIVGVAIDLPFSLFSRCEFVFRVSISICSWMVILSPASLPSLGPVSLRYNGFENVSSHLAGMSTSLFPDCAKRLGGHWAVEDLKLTGKKIK
jgi:hypothetical protein